MLLSPLEDELASFELTDLEEASLLRREELMRDTSILLRFVSFPEQQRLRLELRLSLFASLGVFTAPSNEADDLILLALDDMLFVSCFGEERPLLLDWHSLLLSRPSTPFLLLLLELCDISFVSDTSFLLPLWPVVDASDPVLLSLLDDFLSIEATLLFVADKACEVLVFSNLGARASASRGASSRLSFD